MKQAAEKNLINFLDGKGSFSRKNLLDYFIQTEGDLKEGTLGWRIYDLKKKNILNEIKRGWYTLNVKPVYVPSINDNIQKLAGVFQKNYRDSKYCLWDVNWLNEFTIHQFNQQMLLFETEKDLQESLAHTLNDNNYHVVWSLKGTHLSVFDETVVVLPLISRAPIQKIAGETVPIFVPTLEKVLVDIYHEDKVFHFVQGAEMERIFENALSRYAINFTTFFGYAQRRGKEDELRKFLSTNFPDILIES